MSKAAKSQTGPKWPRRPPTRSDVELLPGTIQLLAKLPGEVKIPHLATRFPRIANRIATDWSKPQILKPYLSGLLIDDRGGRQGFPPEVVAEILKLSRYYETQVFPTQPVAVAAKNVWDDLT